MKNGLYPFGKIAKTHGYSGVLVVVSDRPLPDPPHRGGSNELNEIFLIIDGLYVPFPVIEFTLLTDTSAHIKLEFVNNQTDAVKLAGCEIFSTMEPSDDCPRSDLDQWIGYTIHDSKHGKVGVIQKVEDYKGNIVINIVYEKKETLISFFPELVTNIDDDAKILNITAPDGYF